MKSRSHFAHIAFTALTAILLTGCLLKSKTVSTRHFVLWSVSTNEPASAASQQLSIGIGFVKMPPYLLRNSMAVRSGNEIEYFETVQWGERLDQSFQRTLAANLSRLLPSDSIYLTDFARDQVMATVYIRVEQFDIDTSGKGTLIAQWRITAPDSDTSLKSGNVRLVRNGPSPHGKPEVIATTLSELTAEFSRDLVPPIHESVNSSRVVNN